MSGKRTVVVVEAKDPWQDTKKTNLAATSSESAFNGKKIGFEKKAFMSSKIEQVRKAAFSGKNLASAGNSTLTREEQRYEDYLKQQMQLRKDGKLIEDLGASALKGRDKWLYENKWLESIGAMPRKNQKMPLKHLLRIRKDDKDKFEDQKQLDLQAGNLTMKPMWMKKKIQDEKKRKEKVRSLKSGAPSVGNFSQGKLKVSKSEIAAITRNSIKRRK